MATYAWPNIPPTSIVWGSITNTRAFPSPHTGYAQTVYRKGSRWSCSMSFVNLVDPNAAILRGFLNRLNGQEHRFLLKDYSYVKRGTGSGTVTVNGASQAGTALIIAGLSGTLLVGDRFDVNGELKEVTVDISGAGTVQIFPELHASPSNGAAIDILTPEGTFMLADKGVSWSARVGGFFDCTINIIEDIA